MAKPTKQEIKKAMEFIDTVENNPASEGRVFMIYATMKKEHITTDLECYITTAFLIGAGCAMNWILTGENPIEVEKHE